MSNETYHTDVYRCLPTYYFRSEGVQLFYSLQQEN